MDRHQQTTLGHVLLLLSLLSRHVVDVWPVRVIIIYTTLSQLLLFHILFFWLWIGNEIPYRTVWGRGSFSKVFRKKVIWVHFYPKVMCWRLERGRCEYYFTVHCSSPRFIQRGYELWVCKLSLSANFWYYYSEPLKSLDRCIECNRPLQAYTCKNSYTLVGMGLFEWIGHYIHTMQQSRREKSYSYKAAWPPGRGGTVPVSRQGPL